MSLQAVDVIERLPGELAMRLEADPFFSDIPVVVADEGNVLATLEKKQAAVTAKSGKRGVAVIVLQMIGDDEFAEVNFGPLRLHPSFQVIEDRELNRDASGTGKSGRQVARRIVDVIKPLRLAMMTSDFVPSTPTIEPVKFEKQNLVGYQVNFWCVEADGEPLSAASMPLVTPASDTTVTLASASEATDGAEIWFTTDDTFPAPTDVVIRSTARLYVGTAIDIPAEGLILRAAAYVRGQTRIIASAVLRAEVERQS